MQNALIPGFRQSPAVHFLRSAQCRHIARACHCSSDVPGSWVVQQSRLKKINEARFTIIIIYPLTARVGGAPQMISQPGSLSNSYKIYGRQTPLKMLDPLPPHKKKPPPSDKTAKSYILWLKLNKMDETGLSVLQSADKQRNPSFHIHAPGSKAQMPIHSNNIS